MRESYIKQVKKALMLSRKKKAEIMRDLQEAFVSASEHGETDQQVIERLGTPEDFVASIHEQFGINSEEVKKRRNRSHIGIALIIAFAAFAISAAIHFSKTPPNTIGQADAMTSIQVSGTGIDFAVLFLVFGFIAVIIMVALIWKYISKK
mgnify:CR=1 FL=1